MPTQDPLYLTIHTTDPTYWGSDETTGSVTRYAAFLSNVFHACGFEPGGHVAGHSDEIVYRRPGNTLGPTDIDALTDEEGELLQPLDWWEWWCAKGFGYFFHGNIEAATNSFRETLLSD